MTVLECQDVTCEFDGRRVLNGASLHVADRELVGIEGLNAAGKTSLLNAICGIARLRSGEIRLHGQPIANRSTATIARLGVLRSFENGSLWQNISLKDHIARALIMGSWRDRRKRAVNWLSIFDLPNDGRTARELSLGQRRRLELARVIARATERGAGCIVLLDEPFRGLDTEGRESVCRLLEEHLRGKVTTLMVEHQVDLVDRLATRKVWMEDGRISEVPARHREIHRASEQTATTSGHPVLEIKNLRAGPDGIEVLHGVSLTINEGETVQLSGRNSSGKTTLFRVIMGGLVPQIGELRIFGQRLKHPEDRPAIGIGYAAQGGQLIDSLTVKDHLDFARQVAKRHQRASSLGPAFLNAFPELQEIAHTPAGRLSSGQRSLVSVATAVSQEPQMLIADEIAAGLSGVLKDRLFRFLREIWFSPQRTTLFVEHESVNLPARRIVLERGQFV